MVLRVRMALEWFILNLSATVGDTNVDTLVGMILNSSDMNVPCWAELFVLFSNVPL